MPVAPDYSLDWHGMTATFPWIANMVGSTQDTIHHAEGDVWIHTKMVVESLLGLDEWRRLPSPLKEISFMAAVMHDIAKPATRAIVDGRIRNPHHSRRGAAQSRQILWEMDTPSDLREMTCGIIKLHQMPFWLLENPYWQANHKIVRSSLTVNNHLLYLMATADLLGRISPDQARVRDNIEMFKLMAEDLNCLHQPFAFYNDHSKVAYFKDPISKKPQVELYDPTDRGFVVTITSGLPGAGKSTWITAATAADGALPDQPVVSLDRIRDEMDISQTANQGTVRQHLLEQARILLRQKKSFILEGINLNEDRRAPLISLAMDYGARVNFVCFDPPRSLLISQNRQRADYVPEDVITRMLHKWEPPHPAEAHVISNVKPQTLPKHHTYAARQDSGKMR
jgi:predicted kinase